MTTLRTVTGTSGFGVVPEWWRAAPRRPGWTAVLMSTATASRRRRPAPAGEPRPPRRSPARSAPGPGRPAAARRCGSATRAVTAAASACGSPLGTRSPTPSPTMSAIPPTSLATTARRLAMAETRAVGRASSRLGWMTRSQAANRSSTSSRKPSTRTRSRRSGSWATRSRISASSAPSPARATTSGTSSGMPRSAASRSACPFSGRIRETVRASTCPGPTPSSARTSARDRRGAGSATPFGTVVRAVDFGAHAAYHWCWARDSTMVVRINRPRIAAASRTRAGLDGPRVPLR